MMKEEFDIQSLVRKNIRQLKPYSSARDEYSGTGAILMDANENPFPGLFNRYPDPRQRKLREKVAALKAVRPSRVFLGNGSDEAIDLLFRAFCEPGQDEVILHDPTYGMYEVCAGVQDVRVKKISLDRDFDLDTHAMLRAAGPRTKLIFLCSPNNPTGNALSRDRILALLDNFPGLVVVDEAYQDFSSRPGMLELINEYPNLIVLHTFSKAWGQAGIRLGMAFATEEIIDVMDRIKYPYNLNILTIRHGLRLLENKAKMEAMKKAILEQREWLAGELAALPGVVRVYPSDSNFLLVKFARAVHVFEQLKKRKIIVRDRSSAHLCEGCLRITTGTPRENGMLVNTLKKLTP